MECEKEEYQCSISLSTVFDPVNIPPTTVLYDRNTAETWLEKSPRNSTIPHTRHPYSWGDITPKVALRAEMRQYFQDVMGTKYTGWEVIPDYPQRLSLPAIRDLLAQVRQFFPKEEVELREMGEESWSNAWKRLNYLRLNLQMDPSNLKLFLSDEESIRSFVEIIVLSYSRDAKSEESSLFHREALRTIRALELNRHRLLDQLKPENVVEFARFKGFVLRNLLLGDEGLLPIVLDLLSLIAESLDVKETYCIMDFVFEANPAALSSTDFRNLARILNGFLHLKFIGDIDNSWNTGIQKRLVSALLQILINIVGILMSEYRIGIVEDAWEAIFLSLSGLLHLLEGTQEFEQVQLSFSLEVSVWPYIHELIEMAVEQQSVHWNNLLPALDIVKIICKNSGSADLMTGKEYQLYQSFLNAPVSGHSDELKTFLGIILQMFRDLVDTEESATETYQ